MIKAIFIFFILPIIFLIVTCFFSNSILCCIELIIVGVFLFFGSVFAYGIIAMFLMYLIIPIIFFYIIHNTRIFEKYGIRKITKMTYLISSILLLMLPLFGYGCDDISNCYMFYWTVPIPEAQVDNITRNVEIIERIILILFVGFTLSEKKIVSWVVNKKIILLKKEYFFN